MEQIIYISTARIDPVLSEIESILGSSRRNNARDDLTGLLIVGGRRFLQVLEGPRALLDAAYRRIEADPRHYALVCLERKPITVRSFPDWSMGYQQASSGEALGSVVERLIAPLTDRSLRAELSGFAQLHDRAA